MGSKARQIIFGLLVMIVIVSCEQEQSARRMPTKRDMMEYNRRLVRMDSMCIVAYSDTAGLNTQPTPSGLWITMHEEGSGDVVEKGQTVVLKYKISDLLGHEFYNSERDGEKMFAAGRGHEVSGLDEAVVGMHRGSKATLILMPDKAYGLIGDEQRISGRIILRYDIEVKAVK